ncbi:hypothetical protein [Rhizobium sp. 18065]|uniref:hypothetical protein n=1 Tax=Rhizobium sp. 18065 TaxID=2681411 RepID=UPI00135ADA02|nr:hypothetical protein [Rhizobium sp. 18065]
MARKSKKASSEAMEQLHDALASALATRIAAGEATAADLAVAAKFLKDNGVSRLIDPESPDGSVLTGAKLPDIGDDEDAFEEALKTFQ